MSRKLYTAEQIIGMLREAEVTRPPEAGPRRPKVGFGLWEIA